MRHRLLLAGAAVLVAFTAVGAAIATWRPSESTPAAERPTTATAAVERGSLSAVVSVVGLLTFRAGADGSPYTAINQTAGVYTALPDVGATIDCGAELYRVDDKPVLLLCGTVPAYRGLRIGDTGNDVRQLNANLHTHGHDAAAGVTIDPNSDAFTDTTVKALEHLQAAHGLPATGALAFGDAVVLPEPARIAKVTGQPGGPAPPGTPVLNATSGALEVQVNLEGSQQREVERGDRAQVTLPNNTAVTGAVDQLGTVAQAPTGQNGNPGTGPATITAVIALDDPQLVRGLDQAPVRVEITTRGVDDVLNVPVTAIVGGTGGGFAVEVVREGGRHDVVAVNLGLSDTTVGRVQVEGDLRASDRVVVPSS